MRKRVEELAAGGVGDFSVLKHLGEWQPEDWDAMIGQVVFDMALVEDIAFAVLSDEEDACWMGWGGLVVGVKGCAEACSETCNGSVFWKVGWIL